MISLPMLWIGIPLVLGILLIPFARWKRFSTAFVSLITLALAILALTFPEDLAIVALGTRYEFSPDLFILGRQLSITHPTLTAIALLYLATHGWNLVSNRFRISQHFPALTLITTVLWVAVLSVEPFLYAAVIVTIIMLLSVPLLSPRGATDQPGLFRYLILQTLAMPLILLSGWMLAGIGSAPSASPLIMRGSVMVLLGFILWLGIYPLHTWVPMLTRESHPWVTSWLLAGRQMALLLYFLYFLDRFPWLRSLPNLFPALKVAGLVIITAGGVLTVAEKDYRRFFGNMILIETGYSLLTIGLAPQGGLPYFSLLLPARLLCYYLWNFALSELRELEMNQGTGMHGLFHRAPFIAIGLLVSGFALAGVPLFALFPVKRVIWMLVGGVDTVWLALLAIGTLALLGAMIGLLREVLAPVDGAEKLAETPFTRVVIAFIIVFIVFVGLMPPIFLTPWTSILAPFTNLLNALP